MTEENNGKVTKKIEKTKKKTEIGSERLVRLSGNGGEEEDIKVLGKVLDQELNAKKVEVQNFVHKLFRTEEALILL